MLDGPARVHAASGANARERAQPAVWAVVPGLGTAFSEFGVLVLLAFTYEQAA